MKKPAWATRMDAVNYAVIGIILVVVVWEAVARLVH